LKATPDKRYSFMAGAACGLAAVTVLYFFAPEQHRFYPRCLFYTLTGMQCPGCGGLRAIHRLLHGDLAAAWRFNPLAVLIGPLLAAWLGVCLLRPGMADRAKQILLKPALWWLLLLLGVGYAVLRNVSGF
jgi:hypothetical protein